MKVHLPINVVVTHPPVNWQKAVVVVARSLDIPSERIVFEESPDGLVVHGLTEIDIELAIHELRKTFSELKHGKPQVAYDMGPPLKEPYYRATVDVPVQNLGAVLGDMSCRRAWIQATREGPIGMQLVAEVPVSECFGYDTTLRALTQGQGSYTVEYAGHRSAPFNNRGPDDAA
jgi:predicted membrane GTPase involved in stress response